MDSASSSLTLESEGTAARVGSRAASGDQGPAPTVREFVFASLALVALGVLVYAPARHGGFSLDDWSNGAGALYPPRGQSVLSYFSDLTLYRPVLVLYLPATFLIFGTHMAWHLVWAAALAVFASAMLFGVLRTLGVPRLHAWFVAALTLVYPWFDSTRLWITGAVVTLAVGLAFAGIWLALEGLRRRSWRLHAGAAVLYLCSIWTYEITLPLIVVAGALYTLRSGWRAARARWGVDLVVAAFAALWIGTQTTQEKFGLSADLSHLEEIITAGGTILGRTLLPVGQQRTPLTLLILLVVGIAGFAMLELRGNGPARPARWNLRGWLLMGGGGLLVAVLGWIMFIPANPYFTPSVYGVTNRVNGLSGFGVVIVVYAAIGIVGELAARSLGNRWPVAVGVTIALGLLLGFAYVHVLERHIKIWNSAFRAEEAGLGEMRSQFPRLPAGTTVFTSDYPAYEALGVPIFSAFWDVNGMIKLQYKSGTLSAYPVLPGFHLACNPGGVSLAGAGAPDLTVAYGNARFLNVHDGEHARPLSRRECEQSATHYTPGPQYVGTSY